MNHYDRRGSWAGGWGRKVSRYHGLPIPLAGYAPQRVRSARVAAWQAQRDFGPVGSGSMVVGIRAGTGLVALARAQGYRASGRWMRGKSGFGGRSAASGGSLAHWRSRLSAVRGWKPPPMKSLGQFVSQACAGMRLDGLAVAQRAGGLRGDARARLVGSAPGSLGYPSVAPIRPHGSEIGMAGAVRHELGHKLAALGGRDHLSANSQEHGHQARAWWGSGKGEISAASTEHRVTAQDEAKYRVTDRDMMGWLGRAFGDEARRPPSGPTRCDGLLAPIYPGRKPGF